MENLTQNFIYKRARELHSRYEELLNKRVSSGNFTFDKELQEVVAELESVEEGCSHSFDNNGICVNCLKRRNYD